MLPGAGCRNSVARTLSLARRADHRRASTGGVNLPGMRGVDQRPGGFRVWSKDGQCFDASRVCLATGGERNHGMALAREGGEDPAPVTPAYLRLRLASPKLGERLGLMNREVALRCEKTGEESSGWVSISSRGIEGAALSALSAKVGEPWHQLGYRIKLKVDWLPAASGSSIRGELHSRSVHGGRRTVGESPLLGFTVRQWETFLKAAGEGAIVSEFSSTSRDEFDIFSDPRIKRMPEIEED